MSRQIHSIVWQEYYMLDGTDILQSYESSQRFPQLPSCTVNELLVWLRWDRICRGQYLYKEGCTCLVSSFLCDPCNCSKFVALLMLVFFFIKYTPSPFLYTLYEKGSLFIIYHTLQTCQKHAKLMNQVSFLQTIY